PADLQHLHAFPTRRSSDLGEHFGQPPVWNGAATYIQVDAVPARIGWHVGADVPVVGDPKLVLRQLLDRATVLGVDGARRRGGRRDRKSTRLNSSHRTISYA